MGKEMDLESIKKFLEKEGGEYEGIVDSMPLRFLEPFVSHGIKVDLAERGRIICTLKVPLRLVNMGNFLHGGATASLVDIVGSAAVYTMGAPNSGASVEINVSYLDVAFLDEEVEIEAKVLRMGKSIAVVSVELRKKKTGKIIAQGRHTKYLAVSSKL
ncbi:acyl-coenzyme A thioesterase 13-like [Ipomoea triloba]|uniref:acyl-coenzyme A thioesterase 13-like n=1 Tax=Ipomoea triloba TaxID=35885 RepID=UPI00125E86E7|nr:acyl-coenzyme A thioesterase 13-like [Ipomoea triloba]